MKENKFSKKFHIFEKRTKGERIVFIFVFLIFCIYALSLIFPVLWMFTSSLKTGFQYTKDILDYSPFAMPKFPLKFKNYINAFTGLTYLESTFGMMFFNTIWITVVSTLGGLMVCSGFSYVMSRFEFKGRDTIYGVIIFMFTIPIGGGGTAGMKLILDWGLYDNPLYVLFTTFSGLGVQFMIFYGAYKNLPKEYAEAVYIDGGGEFTLYFKVMFPFLLPVFTSLTVICSVGAWNNYQFPMLYLPSYPTLASGLFLGKMSFIRGEGGVPVYYSAIVITALPMLIMYSCFSNIITKNFTMGGLKG